MLKKELAVAIVVLFLVISVIPGVIGDKSSFGKIIFVDDEPGWGLKNPPEDYTKIQDAIDAAKSGDTIYVFSGVYYENLFIDLSIKLVGQKRTATIIDSNGIEYGVTITADNVSIKGFTIQNSAYGAMGIIAYDCDDLLINDCKIFNNGESGIELSGCNNTIIKNCLIYNNIFQGISLADSRSTTITNCKICNNYFGICVWNSFQTIITKNIIKDNHEKGIDLSSSGNIVYYNTFINNVLNAYDEGGNSWDNGKKGNYWDDYEENYPYAHKKWLRGIWDTPYDIPGGDNHDRFPLTKPYSKSKSYVNPLFLQFLENHLNMFPILRHLLKL